MLHRYYQEGYVAALEKLGVDLQGLRMNNQAIGKNTVLRVPGRLNLPGKHMYAMLPGEGLHPSQQKGTIFINGDIGKLVQSDKSLRNTDMKYAIGGNSSLPEAVRNMSPQNREAINRLAIAHEGEELRSSNKGQRWVSEVRRRPNGTMRYLEDFASHVHPEVILRENNMVATLPKELEDAGNLYRNVRNSPASREAQALKEIIPGFEYGKQRYSRHAIKRMSEIADAKNRQEVARMEQALEEAARRRAPDLERKSSRSLVDMLRKALRFVPR